MNAVLPRIIKKAQILSGNGDIIWEGNDDEKHKAANILSGFSSSFLKIINGQNNKECIKKIGSGLVFAEAERLQFITREGCAKGFINMLPRGTLLNRKINNFNYFLLEKLDAAEFCFPSIYESKRDSVKNLTEYYEKQGRVFHLTNNEHLCLSYAADPGIFQLMENKKFIDLKLPYTIFSDTHYIRNFRSGEINGLNRVREFLFPELHTFLAYQDMESYYLKQIELYKKGMEYWFGNDWIYKCDVRASFYNKNKELFKKMAKLIGMPVYIRILENIPIYYDIKTQFLIDAGYDFLMIYNMQWDTVNSQRFNMKTLSGSPLGIIHGTLAGGCCRLLPSFLGRALAGIGPQSIPPQLTEHYLDIILIYESPLIDELVSYLNKENIIFEIHKTSNLTSIIKKLKRQRRKWICIVGNRVSKLREINIQELFTNENQNIITWVNNTSSYFKCCQNKEIKFRVDTAW